MKKLIYTLHSLERLKQRKITFNQIENCLNNPDKTIIENNIKKAIKKTNNKILIVAYKEENNTIIIITAYKTSKIRKYLQ